MKKRIISTVTALIMALTVVLAVPVGAAIAGDVNGDGRVNARDIIAIMKFMLGQADKGFDEVAADLNGDGKVNARDVIATMKIMITSGSPNPPLVVTDVPLNKLTPINGGWEWNNGNPQDPFGNDYSSPINYAVLRLYHNNKMMSAEYFTDGQYSSISGLIVPHSSFGENDAAVYVQIYEDSELLYTSKEIVRKTDPFAINVNINSAKYLKIVVAIRYGDWNPNSNVLLSDFILTTQNDTSASSTFNNVSLSTLTTFNGGFDWNYGHPKDPFGSDYTYARNYALIYLYGGRAKTYAEYFLDGKYTTISGSIAPYTDFGENSYPVVIQIYADDVLVYTSDEITKKQALINFTVDINHAKYIKIVVTPANNYTDWVSGSNVIISNLLLTK